MIKEINQTGKPNRDNMQGEVKKGKFLWKLRENGHSMIALGAALFMLLLFLPVFAYAILVGNRADYNPDHKIETLFPNTVLLLFALLALLLFVLLIFLLERIPYHKYTIMGTVIITAAACCLFYMIKVEVSKCIAFYGGWDCGMVANSARWVYNGEGMGYDDYYYIFTNNVPITWLLYVLYGFAKSIPGYAYNPEFIWIQYQCMMFSLALFFSVMTVLLVCKRIAPAILSLAGGIIFLGLCPWQMIPYTDASTIAFPIMILFLYVLFRRIKSGYKYILWLFLVFAGVLGGILKATCYIIVIAVAAVEFAWLIFEKEGIRMKLKKFALLFGLLLCGYTLASWCRDGMYETIHFVPDYDLEMTWTNCLYDGLNEATTGACSGDGLAIAQAYAGYPRRFRQSVELHYAKDRIMEKGLGGLLNFWLRKQVMTFNDGTFSWFQEGYFHAWDYEEITDNPLKDRLRDIYWEDGGAYPKFVTWSQGIWIFILLGVILEAVFSVTQAFPAKWKKRAEPGKAADQEELCIYTVQTVAFIGIFFFAMLFEGRARYLLPNIPLLFTMAVLGYDRFSVFVLKAAKKGLSG